MTLENANIKCETFVCIEEDNAFFDVRSMQRARAVDKMLREIEAISSRFPSGIWRGVKLTPRETDFGIFLRMKMECEGETIAIVDLSETISDVGLYQVELRSQVRK